MPTPKFRTAIGLTAAMLTLTSGAAMTLASGGPAGAQPASAAEHASAAESLAQARALLDAGQAVQARALLLDVHAGAETSAEVTGLLAEAERALRAMGEDQVSLQRAELAIERGDLREAEMFASRVRRSSSAPLEAKVEASRVLDRIAQARDEFKLNIDRVLERMALDFADGKYAEAKAQLSAIRRSGVRLDQQTQRTVNQYTQRIVELEREQGVSFDASAASLGVLGPASAGAGAAVDVAVAQPEDPEGERERASDVFAQAQADEAQRLFADANRAYAEGRYVEATTLFDRVLADYARFLTDEQLAQAERRSAEARTLGGLNRQGDETLVDAINQVEIARQQILTEVANLLDQAERALDEGDTETARQRVAEARLRWQSGYNNAYFNEREYRERLEEINELSVRVAEREAEIRDEEARTAAETLEEEAAELDQRQREERTQRIIELLDRLRALQAEQKYDEALQVIEEILFLDPTNPTADLMRPVIEDLMIYRRYAELDRERGLSYARESNRIAEGTIIPDNILDYPDDWPAISFRRGQVDEFTESEADRRVLATLEQTRIQSRFNDDRLEDVLAFVSAVTNLNVDVDWDSLANIGIERDQPVSLDLAEVPARVVLDRVLEKVSPDEFTKAGWAVQDGIVVVASDEDLRRRTFIVIYDVRDLTFPINDYDQVPELDLDSVLQQGQGGGGGGGGGGGSIFGGDEDDEGGIGPSPDEILDQLIQLIQDTVDTNGWFDNGGNTGVITQLNDNLIITNTARNHREIQGLLRQLRAIRDLQISVEARILLVSQDFFERIGFDLDLTFNPGNEQVEAINNQLALQNYIAPDGGSVNPSLLTPGSTLTVPGVIQTPDGPVFGDASAVVPLPTSGWSVVPTEQNSLGLAETLLEGSEFATGILNQNPAFSIAGTFLDDVQVDFLIEATQADRRSVELTAPRLTFTNGKSANVYVARQEAFIGQLTPVVGTSAVAFNPQLQTVSEGTTFVVRGVVSADRRYVTLDVRLRSATIEGFEATEFNAAVAGTGGTDGDGIATGVIEQPIVSITAVNTVVTVPDQGTILLGGQRISTEIETESGVPVLSKLPFLNRFFTNRAMVKTEQSVLLLIKPTIIIQSEEEERNFPGLLDQINDPFGGF